MLDVLLTDHLQTLTPQELEQAEKELNNRCERLEYGLMAIGEMLQSLSYFAQCPEQDYSKEALSLANVAHIGGMLFENAKLLNTFREAQAEALYWQTQANQNQHKLKALS